MVKSAIMKLNYAVIVAVQFVDPKSDLLISMGMTYNALRILGKEAFDDVRSIQNPSFVDINSVPNHAVV